MTCQTNRAKMGTGGWREKGVTKRESCRYKEKILGAIFQTLKGLKSRHRQTSIILKEIWTAISEWGGTNMGKRERQSSQQFEEKRGLQGKEHVTRGLEKEAVRSTCIQKRLGVKELSSPGGGSSGREKEPEEVVKRTEFVRGLSLDSMALKVEV